MIVADTSALVAIVLGEPEYAIFGATLDRQRAVLSGVSLTEALMVVESRRGATGRGDLTQLVDRVIDDVVAIDDVHARAAFDAWRRFGKGRHPASLNLGDCFSYATARLADAPLLFKGDDFAQTDLRSALA